MNVGCDLEPSGKNDKHAGRRNFAGRQARFRFGRRAIRVLNKICEHPIIVLPMTIVACLLLFARPS
jgi:hypothetical protein